MKALYRQIRRLGKVIFGSKPIRYYAFASDEPVEGDYHVYDQLDKSEESRPFVTCSDTMTDEKGLLDLTRIRQRYDSVVQESVGAFGWYQIRLLLVTQLPYLSITGSLMCTLYDNIIPSHACESIPVTHFQYQHPNRSSNLSHSIDSRRNASAIEFHSLIMALGLACRGSYFPTLMTTAVMGGGVVGAGLFGFLADGYGRRCTSVLALLGCCVANLLLLVSVYVHWSVGALVLFVMGVFGGGYMVVNLVLLLENVGKAWRLFCASMNGWPLGFMAMALIGYVCGRWDYYHLTLAALCIPSVLAYYFVHESPRWLMQHGRMREAEEILHEFSRINRRPPISQSSLMAKAAEGGTPDEYSQNARTLLGSTDDIRQPSIPSRRYTYMDLVRCRPILVRLSALTYCWLAASVISFGIYFNMDGMAGNRYVNTFLTGLFKGTTGIIPWLVSRWFGRKPILTISSILTCLSCWGAVLVYFMEPSSVNSPVLTALAILGTSAIDPMWKINHLYSAELFPTVVRNMARAVCNIGSRIGSLLAPQIAYLSAVYFPLPFIIYGVVSVIQVVVALFLPETKGKSLPDRLPSIRNSEPISKEFRVAKSDGAISLA